MTIKYSMEKIHEFDIFKKIYNFDSKIIDQIYNLKELDQGTPKTNIGGWHSKTFTPYKDYYNGRYKWTTSIVESLTSLVQETWPNVTFSRAWFNMSFPGGTNKWHDHGQHLVVSVLYIKTPEPCSAIEFRKNNQTFQYYPKAGDFLVFPGHLEHRVLENYSTEDRISLAVNFDQIT